MIAMNFGKLKDQLQLLIDRNPSSNLSWLGDKINDAYIEMGTAFKFDSLRRTAFINITAPYLTGTIAVNIQSTAVTGNGTAFTKTMEGQSIVINGQRYGILTVTSGTALTLDRPYEGTSNITADSTAIYFDSIQLPYGCDYSRIFKIRDPKNENILRGLAKDKFDSFFPNPFTTGDPVVFSITGYKTDRYPATGTVALAATSSATSAVLPVGPATVDDYYNDWTFINATREGVSRVMDYNGTTRTVTIDPAITGQVATDTVYIEKRLPYINLYPLPDTAHTLVLTYYKISDKLVNDYDVPFDVPDRYHRAIYLRAAIHSNLIRDDARLSECRRQYEEYLTKMNEEFNCISAEEYSHDSIDGQPNIDMEFDVYKFPLGS